MAERLKWTYRMEEAYDAAVGQCGGLEAAKPKGVFEAMQATGEFPELTLQAVKWHLQSHRRREAREREHGPSTEIKWTGRLEQLYESAVASLGGIWAAKPKDIHAQLVAEFPDITVQSTKWHLYAQRRAEERIRQRQEGGTPSSAAQQQQDDEQQEQEQEQETRQRSATRASRPGAKRRQSSRQRRRPLDEDEEEEEQNGEAPSPHMPRQQSAPSLVSMPGAAQPTQQDGAAPAAAVAAQAPPLLAPPLAWGDVQSGMPRTVPSLSPASAPQLQPARPAASSAAAASGSLASQQWQQQQHSVGRPAPLRPQQAPWITFAYAAACRALVHRQRRMQFIRQVVMELEQQARELQMVIDGLEAASSDGDSASLLPLLGTSLSGGLGGSNTLPPLAAAAPGGSLAAVPAALLRAVASATAAQPQRSIAAGAAVGRLHGGGLGWPTAQGGGSGGSSGGAGSGPAAPGAAPGPYQKRAHDPASCTAPNCRLCAYEQRLQQRAGQPKAGGQQHPHPPFLQPAAVTQQQQQQPAGLPAAESSGLPLGSDHSDVMAKAVLEATGLLEEAGLASGGLSAPLLDALLHNLPSMPTLLPHPPPS